MICDYWFFNHGFKFQDFVYNRCHGLMMFCLNINDIDFIAVKEVDYCCIIHDISKSEAINLLKFCAWLLWLYIKMDVCSIQMSGIENVWLGKIIEIYLFLLLIGNFIAIKIMPIYAVSTLNLFDKPHLDTTYNAFRLYTTQTVSIPSKLKIPNCSKTPKILILTKNLKTVPNCSINPVLIPSNPKMPTNFYSIDLA